MSERHVQYLVSTPLKTDDSCVTLTPELRAKLEDVRRKAIALLLSVEDTLGIESSVETRAQRRAR